MDSPDSADQGRTRRRFLGGTAGVATGALGGSVWAERPAPDDSGLTVLTQNLYLGFKLARLLAARSPSDFRRIVGGFRDGIDPARYRARADAIADQIAATDADVVALQEAVELRKQQPGDFYSEGSEAAGEQLVDLLGEVKTALSVRGLDYETAAVLTASDAELPASTDEGPVDLRITDRDVLLVAEGIDVDRTVSDTFEADLSLEIPGSEETVSLQRGYARADLSRDGDRFTAVTTHLEALSSLRRVMQTGELLEVLPGDRPVVLAGDLNSGPGDPAYRLLCESFSDAFETIHPHAAGHTCCRGGDLGENRSNLEYRIDAVLYRGDIDVTDVGRVNHRQKDRITVDSEGQDHGTGEGAKGGDGSGVENDGDDTDGEADLIWPSDHAGVVASLDLGENAGYLDGLGGVRR